MKTWLMVLFICMLTLTMTVPAMSASDSNNSDEKKIGTDDYIMCGVGALMGAGIQEIYYREKPVVESRAPSIVMGYFIWNAIVVVKELNFDDPPEDRMRWEDVAIANAGFTLGTLIWHYTVGKNIKEKPRKHVRHHNYLRIGDKQTQIKLF